MSWVSEINGRITMKRESGNRISAARTEDLSHRPWVKLKRDVASP
jgi:hypothetical protein